MPAFSDKDIKVRQGTVFEVTFVGDIAQCFLIPLLRGVAVALQQVGVTQVNQGGVVARIKFDCLVAFGSGILWFIQQDMGPAQTIPPAGIVRGESRRSAIGDERFLTLTQLVQRLSAHSVGIRIVGLDDYVAIPQTKCLRPVLRLH